MCCISVHMKQGYAWGQSLLFPLICDFLLKSGNTTSTLKLWTVNPEQLPDSYWTYQLWWLLISLIVALHYHLKQYINKKNILMFFLLFGSSMSKCNVNIQQQIKPYWSSWPLVKTTHYIHMKWWLIWIQGILVSLDRQKDSAPGKMQLCKASADISVTPSNTHIDIASLGGI